MWHCYEKFYAQYYTAALCNVRNRRGARVVRVLRKLAYQKFTPTLRQSPPGCADDSTAWCQKDGTKIASPCRTLQRIGEASRYRGNLRRARFQFGTLCIVVCSLTQVFAARR